MIKEHYSHTDLMLAMREVRTELDRYVIPDVRDSLADACPPLSMRGYGRLAMSRDHDLADFVYMIMETANDLVYHGTPLTGVSSVPLVQAAVAMSRVPNRADMRSDVRAKACLQAEVRIVRSLNNPGHSAPAGAPQRPAEVLLDANGEPFAYRKCSGLDTAFAWREATIATERGPLWLPGSCFFELFPKDRQPGTRPEDVGFLRFSTHVLHPAIARAAYEHVAQYPSDEGFDGPDAALLADTHLLYENTAEAAQLTPFAIGQRACKLFTITS